MSNINKQAQYESKFSRLWERYDEASHGNAEQMRDILEVTLDALESAERQILKLEKLAEAESVGADKAATSGVEWMKLYHAAEKRIAELSHHLQCAHGFIEHTEAFGHEASNGILCCGDAQWNIDESKSVLAAAGKGERA
ncbi:hypothetical protein [Citrobacter freundii]|uniref:hypothetical protein n=1 Tax=Citrobacter freundii TaxID=546 RepID=UPI001A1BB390|nr:hypothetical protein [Citrobacter freundii]EMB6145801.1 hypothetical protein [Enterobacter asburiae]MCO4109048.1 hypothetical protein [Citrobacter freundii]MDH0215534.1 hypothetical protein [Citrobacter freundii]MDH0227609.1 hypothetical protein [Citrobacter freundii]MDH0244092.1 hypothetical protein [Citrobacter freundii]